MPFPSENNRRFIFLKAMYENILTPEQMVLAERQLPAYSDFYLASGTAFAFQMKHRRSINFDFVPLDQHL